MIRRVPNGRLIAFVVAVLLAAGVGGAATAATSTWTSRDIGHPGRAAFVTPTALTGLVAWVRTC